MRGAQPLDSVAGSSGPAGAVSERVATRIQECVYSALGQMTEAARSLKTVPVTQGPQDAGGRKELQETLVRAIAAVVSVLTSIRGSQ
jgi:hypothetical protein